jgi:alpha-glucosidase
VTTIKTAKPASRRRRPRDPDAWWKHGVIYQIYPRSFADSDGDGTGDLRGIIDRLDYLNDGTPDSLGVDAIWLSPIHPSPGFDVGYDVADYDDIDPLFGSLEDFDELVAQAHRRGIRIILDLVMNHTSHLHPWFVASRSSRDDPKRDWYIWREAAPGRRYPNNWRSFFGGSAWKWDRGSRQFYLHTFLDEQPDLNWQNPQVKREMLAMIGRWLDRGVDGFRLDVFNSFFKHAGLPDAPVRRGFSGYFRLAHVYDKDQPELSGFLSDFRALLDRKPGRMSVGELFGGTVEQAAGYAGAVPDRLHLVFDFRFLEQPWKAEAIQRTIAEWEAALDSDWPCYVLGNHDRSRLATRYGRQVRETDVDRLAKVAAALLLTLRGTPFVYYGEELAMRDEPIPRDRMRDTPATRFGRTGGWESRDPARTPMQWAPGPWAGFTTREPWLPIGADADTRNVALQSRDPDSVLSWYRRLIWLRRGSPALNSGSYRPLLERPERTLAYLREAEGERMLVALNLSDEPQVVSFEEPPTGDWQTALSSHASRGTRLRDGQLTLEPFESLILRATG